MKRLVSFINKYLTHNRDDDGDFGIRVLLHIPIGGLIAYLLFTLPWLGIGLLIMFLVYEWTEDWRVNDHAWKDLYGSLAGFVGVSVIITLIEVITNGT